MATPAMPAIQMPDAEDQHEDQGDVDAQGIDHAGVGNGRAHDLAQTGLVQQQRHDRQDHQRQADDEQPVDRIVQSRPRTTCPSRIGGILSGRLSVPQMLLTPARMIWATPSVRINSPIWPKACTFLRRNRSISTPQTAVASGASSKAIQKFPVRLTNWKPR